MNKALARTNIRFGSALFVLLVTTGIGVFLYASIYLSVVK
jgi:hypothetical protein